MERVRRLRWDSAFFGVPMGLIDAGVRADRLPEVLEEASELGLRCVYLLIQAEHAERVRAAEEHGMRMQEIRLRLERPVTGHPTGLANLRPARSEDFERLAEIVRERFTGTRFTDDERLPADRRREVYVEWLRRGTSNADRPGERETLISEDGRGFVVCHLDEATATGRIELIALDGDAGGRGLGSALVAGAGTLYVRRSLTTATVVTQGGNLAAQRLYQACGYRTVETAVWMNAWLAR